MPSVGSDNGSVGAVYEVPENLRLNRASNSNSNSSSASGAVATTGREPPSDDWMGGYEAAPTTAFSSPSAQGSGNGGRKYTAYEVPESQRGMDSGNSQGGRKYTAYEVPESQRGMDSGNSQDYILPTRLGAGAGIREV